MAIQQNFKINRENSWFYLFSIAGSWLSCAVFCKTSSGAWHSPRKELENLNVDPYFPDGVWCHVDRESNTNYYCQNHLCMPGQPGGATQVP